VERGPERGRGRRWLLAGGILGLALSPAAAPYRRAVAARALRLRPPLADPVAAFREAPCYAHDDAAADAAREEALRWEPGAPRS
jgi:hypothetical protein